MGFINSYGLQTHSSEEYSTAMGNGTIASGGSSTAMGEDTTASGDYSTAMGFGNIKYLTGYDYQLQFMLNRGSSGDSSTAMGFELKQVVGLYDGLEVQQLKIGIHIGVIQ